MRCFHGWMVAALLVVVGCDLEGGITPTETVIERNSTRDFGFAGEWVHLPDRDHPQRTELRLKIERGETYRAAIYDVTGKIDTEIRVQFRAQEMFPDHPHAFVEIEGKESPYIVHHLAIAAVKDDHLYLWSIDGRKLGEMLYADSKPAVIEHTSSSSRVRCKPELLLETLRNHAKEVMGSAQVYRRVK